MESLNFRQVRPSRMFFSSLLLLLTALLTTSCGEIAAIEDIGGTNSLMVSWTAPTTNEDGSALDDLAGYKVYYGNSSGSYSNVIDVGSFTNAEIDDLAPGTYYLAVTAYDIFGNESNFSEEIDHTFF